MTTTNTADPQIIVTQDDLAVLMEDPVVALRTKVISLTRIAQEQAQEITTLKAELTKLKDTWD